MISSLILKQCHIYKNDINTSKISMQFCRNFTEIQQFLQSRNLRINKTVHNAKQNVQKASQHHKVKLRVTISNEPLQSFISLSQVCFGNINVSISYLAYLQQSSRRKFEEIGHVHVKMFVSHNNSPLQRHRRHEFLS